MWNWNWKWKSESVKVVKWKWNYDLWHLRHWLLNWKWRTWIHDNLCDLTINSGNVQHLQFLQCFDDEFTISHTVSNFTHNVYFYTQCSILHTEYNFTHSVFTLMTDIRYDVFRLCNLPCRSQRMYAASEHNVGCRFCDYS